MAARGFKRYDVPSWNRFREDQRRQQRQQQQRPSRDDDKQRNAERHDADREHS